MRVAEVLKGVVGRGGGARCQTGATSAIVSARVAGEGRRLLAGGGAGEGSAVVGKRNEEKCSAVGAAACVVLEATLQSHAKPCVGAAAGSTPTATAEPVL